MASPHRHASASPREPEMGSGDWRQHGVPGPAGLHALGRKYGYDLVVAAALRALPRYERDVVGQFRITNPGDPERSLKDLVKKGLNQIQTQDYAVLCLVMAGQGCAQCWAEIIEDLRELVCSVGGAGEGQTALKVRDFEAVLWRSEGCLP